MSNNQKTEKNEVKYVPKLRFSEFKKEKSWKKKQLQNVCEINPQSKKLPDSFIYIDLESVNDGRLLKKQHINVENAPSRAQRVLQINDILFQTVRPYQKNNYLFLIKDKYEYIASTGYAQLRANESVHYLYQYIHTDNFVNAVLKKSTGTNYPAINSAELAKIDILIPNLAEQQKIASCISSLDELIQNESSKLEAYKQHKSGLLQQLFPRDGGSLPSIRFDEFSENWRKQKIGDFIEDFLDKSTSHNEYEVFTSSKSGLMKQTEYYENSRLSTRDNSGFNVIPPNYITYRSRSDNRKFYFNENKLGVTGLVSTYYPVFKIVNGFNHFFIELFSRYQDEIGKYSIGTSQTVLSIKELKRISLPVPKTLEEQQKIAKCLSSIDDLIIHQNNYIDKLKEHKKGLMQQLFPVLEEASA
ncbi:restriction endonuclease subunit S [Acinetobacter bereziniae]|uniref:restriction endonuclease subunit S n=1 Tax=Acinetobacter bereziniae TaxID=106648 RepID=UPI00300893E1